MSFAKHLDRKVILISAVALSVVALLTANSIWLLIDEKQDADIQMRDARQAAFNADFEVALVRAAGEAASFAVTKREGFLGEAKEALAQAHAAVDRLRKTLGDNPPTKGLEGKHLGFIERQREVLAMLESGFLEAQKLGQKADQAALDRVLDDVFAYEPKAEQLRKEVSEHRELEYTTGARDLANDAQAIIYAVIFNLAAFVCLIGIALAFTRRYITRPIDHMAAAAASVAEGDFSQRLEITSKDEIGQLQSAFNQMVTDLQQQHRVLRQRNLQLTETVEKAQKAEQRLDLAVQATQLALWDFDASKNALYLSERWAEMLGGEAGETAMTLDGFIECVHPDDQQRCRASLDQCISGSASTMNSEQRVPHRNGGWVWLESHGKVVERDDNGRALRIIGTHADITERKRAEEELRESERRFREIAENMPGVVCTSTPDGNKIYFISSGYEELFGRTRASLIENPKTLLEGMHPEDRQRVVAQMGRPARGEAFVEEYRVVRPDGSLRWVSDRAFPIKNAQGELYRVCSVTEDITPRKEMEEQLRRSREQLRHFAANLNTEIESERSRIAHALHDELGQNLTALRMYLGRLQKQCTGNQPAHEMIDRAQDIVGNAGTAMRRIVGDLRPLALDNFGLVAAAETLVKDFSASAGLAVDLKAESGFDDLPDSHKTALYRVLQESLNNIAKHAQASSVKVRIEHADSGVTLTVRDDGRGLSPDARSKPDSYGLFGMAERAAQYSGNLSIDSAPGAGTKVSFWLPLATARLGATV
jgi:PAS domain S-box-containing protein